MTRAQIRAKYGIERIEHPDIANKELTPEEARSYELNIQAVQDMFVHWDDEEYWNGMDGDID